MTRNVVANARLATSPANLPALPKVKEGDWTGLLRWVSAMTERSEVREGQRGNPFEKAVTLRDLQAATGISNVVLAGTPQGTVVVQGAGGQQTTLSIDQFADLLRNTRLYRDLAGALDDPARFDALGERVKALVLPSIAELAEKTGAGVRVFEQKVQNAGDSFAAQVTEVTAAIHRQAAGVRQTLFAQANDIISQAGFMTQVHARLNDFGGGSATIEVVMAATASRTAGLASEYMVKLSAGRASVGFGLAASEDPLGNTISDFIVEAGRFGVTAPVDFAQESTPTATAIGQTWYRPSTEVSKRATATGTGGWVTFTPKVPFGVDTTNDTVYINGQVRINAGGTQVQDIANFNFIGSYSSAPATTSLKKNNVYLNTTDGNTYILTADAGAWTLWIQKGANGTNGTRGSLTGNGFQYGIRTSSWSDTLANRVIENMNTGTTSTSALATVLMTAPGLVLGDMVTLGDGNPWSTTRGAWSSGTAYVQNEISIYSGIAYRAIQPGTNKQPNTNPAYWAAIGNATSRGAWAASTAYAQNDYVTSSGTTYLARWKHTSDASAIATDLATPESATTKYWGGASWLLPGVIIDGNLLVHGTVSADVIYGGTLAGLGISISSSAGGFALHVLDGGTVVGYRTLDGYNITAANGAAPTTPAVKGTSSVSTTGPGVQGFSDYDSGGGISSAGVGVHGLSYSANAGGHGFRGEWNKFGMSAVPARGVNNGLYASGLVGATNGNAFYAEAGAVGPFTGAHEVAIAKELDFEVGDIVVDDTLLLRGGVSNTLFSVALSSAPNQPGIVGVLAYSIGPMDRVATIAALPGNPSVLTVDADTGIVTGPAEYEAIKADYDLASANALGEGMVNVCGEGGDIARGDLIVTSSTPGKGMKQGDNLLRSHTVAKARESVAFASPSEVRTVACFYVSG